MKKYKNFPVPLPFFILAVFLIFTLGACKMSNDKVLPRNQTLPLFNPHVADFVCETEASKVPPIDAQAEDWFLEARALEDPEIFMEDRDYKKIVALTHQAAERLHWKAMLNLASLYVEGRDPLHSEEEAVQLVEKAMRLGIPAAYDRMGTYYANGTGVNGDITRAYAFWQKAAQMGNPQAMDFLSDKLNVGLANEGAGYWANIPVAIKMMECAFSQGYGPVAYNLSYMYASPRMATGRVSGPRTPETKALALKVLHEGVAFGCEKCANKLTIEFGDPFDLADMLVPYVDKARGERYAVLGNELGFNPNARFPNLDKVLPLPPADLPPWNGDRDTLLHAAKGVRPPPAVPQPSAAALLQPPYFLVADYALRPAGWHSDAPAAPFAAYWQPVQGQGVTAEAQLFQQDEPFRHFSVLDADGDSRYGGVSWEQCLTIRHDHGAVQPRVAHGLLREVARPQPWLSCACGQACPVSGVWQPWVSPDHPLQAIVNQYWRQSWLTQGAPFPRPRRDWLLDLRDDDVTWHLMDASLPDLG
ncbi:tetratricopeptide repeat protein [Janthinobacterium lividum]|uniref:tetratricopeptide repeat protein n=1 Tax=Janthinobacterium lividum TaxID=29581 RepID=UPI00140D1BBB|nr:tetratricopeptide repeat protein [Janthinobacterium lividum]NHQ91479.1 sel1 repeat family protein [Janthinobacterium lividum]